MGKIRVKDHDLRVLLAKSLSSSRGLRSMYPGEDWHKTFIRGMAQGKIIAFEMIQDERDKAQWSTSPDGMSFADHAEAWARENGMDVPERRYSPEWMTMYERWHVWAWRGIGEV